MTEQTAITTTQKVQVLSINDIARDLAQRLKFMIQNGRNLADNEVYALAQYCAANDLNPFAGEAYYLPNIGPCPGIAGWRKKAQEQLNWEAAQQKELGAHFWVEFRDAYPEEAGHDPEKGDIGIVVILHDWLSNKRWRRAYFETFRELKDLGYPINEAEQIAEKMVGPEPVWQGIGVVFSEEKFGGDKFNRHERAQKRAEKVALRKRFPRIDLADPVNADADYVDGEFTQVGNPQAGKTEAQLIAELTGEPTPGSGKPAETAPDPLAWRVNWPQDAKLTWEMATTIVSSDKRRYVDIETATLSHMANAITGALKKNGMTPEEHAEKQLKLDCIENILKARSAA